MGGNQDNFAVIPVTTGMNRFGRWNRSLNILVQAGTRHLRRNGRTGAWHYARGAQSSAGRRR